MKSIHPKSHKIMFRVYSGKRSSSGFTLVELMITIAIFTVMLSIAVPSYQSMVRSNTAEELVNELQLARMIALRRQTPVTVAFPQAGENLRQFTVTWVDRDDGTVKNKLVDLGGMGEGFQFDNNPPGADPPGPNTTFIFSPLGFISTENGTTAGDIYLSNRAGNRFFQIHTTIAGGMESIVFNTTAGTWPDHG